MDVDDVHACANQRARGHELTLHLVVALLAEVFGGVERFVRGDDQVEVEGDGARPLDAERTGERRQRARPTALRTIDCEADATGPTQDG